MSDSKFWDRVHAVAAKATWAYLATAVGLQPKVRVVHPAFEGERVWVATGRASAKARHIQNNPKVELFYQISAEMVHLTVTGKAKFVEDVAEKKRIWNGKIFDYDLAQFWPGGPESKDFGLMLITPDRVELTSLAEMTTGKKPEVWRAGKG
ncbi:MAG: pyridoxamine 5'-phosphate oxidase family protein [Candidatus Binatus sp.]